MEIPRPPLVQCEVKTRKDFEQLRLYLTKVFECFQDKTTCWVFRGQSKSSWELSTTLERFISDNSLKPPSHIDELKTIIEYHQKLNNILSYTHTKNSTKQPPYLKSLVDIQHYGGKTRLLDFTEDLNVALYFAITQTGTSSGSSNDEQLPVIWAVNCYNMLNQSRFAGKYIDRKCVKLNKYIPPTELEADPFIEESFRDSVLDHLLEIIGPSTKTQQMHQTQRTGAKSAPPTSDRRRTRMITRLLKNDRLPPDVVPIFPLRTNKRIKAQKGLFLCPTTFKPFEENLLAALKVKGQTKIEEDLPPIKPEELASTDFLHSPPILKIVLHGDFLASATEILIENGINTETLFPDKTGIISSLTYSH